ncbi:MAG: KpsF/GutQ family sugar-phosphate isomerase [Pseudomonadota bacterium]
MNNLAPPTDVSDIGRDVINREAAALHLLSDSLDGSFSEAVRVILAASGRTIVSGMGKSGHIARKVAATFASTGTPAHFVHPAEASHGDLGMMAQGDAVLVFSKSGETPEIADLIAHTRRFEIPLIGIAGKRDSTLIRQSDVGLVLPAAEEACGTGVVPSTSTTMSLALGDALAIALMRRRNFTPENFRDFHPGGKLGARLSKVRDLMHTGDQLPLVSADTSMQETLLVMTQKGFGVVGVTDTQGLLLGIITDGDLRRNMDGLLDRLAGDVMTAHPKTIAPGALAEAAVATMTLNSPRVTCLFVVDPDVAGQVAGLIHIHDCLRAGVL